MDMTESSLTTADELMLLVIDPSNGKLSAHPPHTLPLALAGAMLMDLVREQRIAIIDGNLAAGADTGEALCDAILARIRRMPIPQGIGYWVNALGAAQFRAQDRVTWRLIERRLITIDVRVSLGVLASTRYVIADPDARRAVAAKVGRVLVTDEAPDPQVVSLLGMAVACGILDRLSDRRHRITARRRARAILGSDEAVSDAARSTSQFLYAASAEI
jgi:hypothetical protein